MSSGRAGERTRASFAVPSVERNSSETHADPNVAMGYWTDADLPVLLGLGPVFPPPTDGSRPASARRSRTGASSSRVQ